MGIDHGVVVLVDKKLKGYALFEKVVVPVLDHWKFPYQWLDIRRRELKQRLSSAAVVLIWQPGLGRSLNEVHVKALEQAVRNGVGLFVGEQSFLRNRWVKQSGSLRALCAQVTSAMTNSLNVSNANHFIAATKFKGEHLEFDSKFKICTLKGARVGDAVIANAKGQPAYIVCKIQSAQHAIFLFSTQTFYSQVGFGTGLDALLMRGVIYVAKKPFVQLVPPKFITFRVEDSIGEGDYQYLDHLMKSGFKVHLGLDLNDFDFKHKNRLRREYQKKRLEFSPHAFTHYKKTETKRTELIYVGFDGKPLSKQKLKQNFDRLDHFEKKAGFKFSPVLTYHYCQLGKNALPMLKKKGVKYLTFPFLSNANLKQAFKKNWRRHPYGKLGLVCDEYPEDRDFFTMVSLLFPRSKSKNSKMGVDTTSQLDFLFGLRLKAPGKKFNQYKEVSSRAQRYLNWAYENMFFANFFTHETLINYLRLTEFKKVVSVLKAEMKKHSGLVQARYQDIARYYESRYRSSFKSCKPRRKGFAVTVGGPRGSVLDYTIYRNGRSGRVIEKRGKINTNREKVIS